MNLQGFTLMVAPMQGFTDAAFRHFHSGIYGDGNHPEVYTTPFIRLEKGEIRSRDLRDLNSPLNGNHRLLPQIIFRDEKEFSLLIKKIREERNSHVDLNLGCPFPPQVNKGRGSGLLAYPERFDAICNIIRGIDDMTFSIKMRLGVADTDQWKSITESINSTPFTHLTVHPRTAAQQYGGDVYLESFHEIYSNLKHPIVWNGDITTPRQIDALIERFPDLKGIMVGRGLLMLPSLFAEWREGREWLRDERVYRLLALHDALLSHYIDNLTGGEAQILSHIKPFWNYFGAEFDRKVVKKLVKSNSLQTYRANLRQIS